MTNWRRKAGRSGVVFADACAILAFFTDTGSSSNFLEAMQGDVSVSAITVWELTQKASSGKLPPLPLMNGSFSGWLVSQGFRSHPLSLSDAERSNALPAIHKDPMDRMLIAQALTAGCAIVTSDRVFAQYGVQTIW